MKKELIIDGVKIVVGSEGVIYDVEGNVLPEHLAGAKKNRRCVSINGKSTKIYYLVMEAFSTKPQGEEKWHIHHINGDSMDDRLENLVWITASEHGKIHKRASTGKQAVRLVNTETGETLEFKNKTVAAEYLGVAPNYLVRLDFYKEWKIEKTGKASSTEQLEQEKRNLRKIYLKDLEGNTMVFDSASKMAEHFGFSRENARRIVKNGQYLEWKVSKGQEEN
ncbi:MAG: HNH endonuclease signature motif containing protein [Aeromonadaceae bacterium]